MNSVTSFAESRAHGYPVFHAAAWQQCVDVLSCVKVEAAGCAFQKLKELRVLVEH